MEQEKIYAEEQMLSLKKYESDFHAICCSGTNSYIGKDDAKVIRDIYEDATGKEIGDHYELIKAAGEMYLHTIIMKNRSVYPIGAKVYETEFGKRGVVTEHGAGDFGEEGLTVKFHDGEVEWLDFDDIRLVEE